MLDDLVTVIADDTIVQDVWWNEEGMYATRQLMYDEAVDSLRSDIELELREKIEAELKEKQDEED